MAVALRGSAVATAANPTTTFTLVIDAAVTTGDLLFVTVTSRDSTAGSSDVTCTDDDTGGNAWTVLTNTADKKAWIFWKRATSGTASKTITIANAVGSTSGVLKAFSGGSAGATPYADVVTETNADLDTTHAGYTPTYSDSMLCTGIFSTGDNGAIGSVAFATAGSVTNTNSASSGGSDCANGFGHLLQSGGPSATGDLTWTEAHNPGAGQGYSVTWSIIDAVHDGGGATAIPVFMHNYRRRRQ